MPKYNVLLLDADGTFFDFVKAERVAFTHTFQELGYSVDDDTIDLYSQINDALWKALERGETTKEHLVIQRYATLLEQLSIDGDPVEVNARYAQNLSLGNFLLPGAEEVCRELAAHCTLILATNGLATVQRQRLKTSAIAPYISQIVVSEDAGAAKPEEQFFRYAHKLCGGFDPTTTLMVGDSLVADILGGIRFGLDTCWYNPHGFSSGDPHPTYTISRLEELVPIVLGSKEN